MNKNNPSKTNNNKIKLAIIGSRNYDNYNEFKHLINKFINSLIKNNVINNINDLVIVPGGAKGANSLAKKYAIETKIEIKEILPEWKKYGKKAGFIRNYEIWKEADLGFGFWDGKSKGTSHSIKIAKEIKKDLIMFVYPDKKWKTYKNGNILNKIIKEKKHLKNNIKLN